MNMPRTGRIVIPGVAHHVTQRGNSGQLIYHDEQDRENYLDLLRHYAEKHGLRVLGYCLMTNHVHIVGVPQSEPSLANAIGLTHQLYTTYFHDKYQGNGHLWQSRFFSCPMDENHTINALAYTELNPVRAGMVQCAQSYEWSSASAHLGLCEDALLDLTRWFGHFNAVDWSRTLEEFGMNTRMADSIRRHTRKGAPLGRDKRFLERLDSWRSSGG